MKDFMSPVPKEYGEYSDREVLEHSERYIRQILDLHQEIKKIKPQFLGKVEQYIQGNEKFSQCCCFLCEHEYMRVMGADNDLQELWHLGRVTLMEEDAGIASLLRNSGSFSACQKLYHAFVFYFRRMEMGWKEAEYEGILDYVDGFSVSGVALAGCLSFGSISYWENVIEKMFELLWKRGKKEEAMQFVFGLQAYNTEDEGLLLYLTNLLLEKKERDFAYGLLKKHPHPDERIEKLLVAIKGDRNGK